MGNRDKLNLLRKREEKQMRNPNIQLLQLCKSAIKKGKKLNTMYKVYTWPKVYEMAKWACNMIDS